MPNSHICPLILSNKSKLELGVQLVHRQEVFMNPLNDKTANSFSRVAFVVLGILFITGLMTYDVSTYAKKTPTDYQVIYKDTNSLELGTSKVKQDGDTGVKTTTYEKKSIFGITFSEVEISSEVTKKAKDYIILEGTREKYATPTPTPAPPPQCDSNYSGYCVPIVSYDLDCSDIGYNTVYVEGADVHHFDADYDRYGCE